MSEIKASNEVIRDFFANLKFGDDETEIRPPDMTEEQWAEHDARVAAEQAKRDRERTERLENERMTRLAATGIPRRALEIAKACAETAAIAELRKWNFERANVVVLSGPPGCGKSVAAAWWALNSNTLPTWVRATTFAATSRFDRDKRDEWLRAGALVLDDLGTEYIDAKGSFLTDLDELIDTYYGDRAPLVITTNCRFAEFKERYGARILDRLTECGKWISVLSTSLRRKEEP